VQRAYRQSTVLLGSVLAVIGVIMVVRTVAGGGGPLALGVVVGVLLAVLGAARVFLATRRPRGGSA
jgi:drug/metabolite transporter (DMT)-like permease